LSSYIAIYWNKRQLLIPSRSKVADLNLIARLKLRKKSAINKTGCQKLLDIQQVARPSGLELKNDEKFWGCNRNISSGNIHGDALFDRQPD